MPAYPVDSERAWAYWQAGVISATNAPTAIALPAYETRELAAQRPILRNLASRAALNAIRISFDLHPIEPGPDGLHEIDVVAERGWGDERLDRKTPFHSWVEPELQTLASLAAHIDRVLEQCRSIGMGVILCVGNYHANKLESLWDRLQRHHNLVRFWSQTARRWPGHPALIGFELLNEPSPGFAIRNGAEVGLFHSEMLRPPEDGHPESDLHYNPQNYLRLMNRCVQAIRAHAPDVPIIVNSIHGGHADGLDFFRVKTGPDLDRARHNTEWPAQWSPLDKPLQHGRNPYYGLDRSAQWSPTDRGRLVQDPAGRIVYTFHMYTPPAFTLQGIDPWAYHAIGMLYPRGDRSGDTLLAEQVEWRDGLLQVTSADYSRGLPELEAACKRAVAFRKDFDVPVFVGEFSAASLQHIRSLPRGLAPAVQSDDTEVRQIVGLRVQGREVTVVLRRPLQIPLDNRVDAAGRPYSAHDVLLDIDLRRAGGRSIGLDKVPVTLYGVRYAPGAPTRYHRNQNHTFSFKLPEGIDLRDAGPGPDDGVAAAGRAMPIGTFRIVITPELAERHETSRVAYVRDVLRLCRNAGFSWAYFSDALTPPRPDLQHDFFRVDAGGRMRDLLRRAAFRSCE